MKPEDIRPGVDIIVLAGADAIRKRPYRLTVDKILPNSAPGRIHVAGTLCRMSGARSNAGRRVATIDPAKVRLATEEDGR